MNLETCRILITIPECLEMLLLSSNYQRWCQRIRYCIFDEIHCMSGDPGTDVWERTMLLINCPMIGLSATVNNGKNVQEWIGHVENERSRLFRTSAAREVCLITHYVRLADLNKYLYSLASHIRQHIQTYNGLVRDIYGSYIENVIEKIRSINNDQEFLLPFSQISFKQSSDYENGTFEYQLHHHHSQQSHNPSISPFAAPSGLTHEQFMSNYHSTTGAWDLAYDLDLSSRLVPYVDIDACDQTNTSYYLNSYALDYFKHGSEKFLISENQLDRGEPYHLLSDFLFSSLLNKIFS